MQSYFRLEPVKSCGRMSSIYIDQRIKFYNLVRVTQEEPEARESWKAIDDKTADQFKKNSLFSQWDFGAGKAIKMSTDVIKVCTHSSILA